MLIKKYIKICIVIVYAFSTSAVVFGEVASKPSSLTFLAPQSEWSFLTELTPELSEFSEYQNDSNIRVLWHNDIPVEFHETWRGVDHRAVITEYLTEGEFLSESLEKITATILKQTGEGDLDVSDVLIMPHKRGSQKETYHVRVILNSGVAVQFAVKITINKAVQTGFRKQEIDTLKRLTPEKIVPTFGAYASGKYYNQKEKREIAYQLYSERWISGPTVAEVKRSFTFGLSNLRDVISAWMKVPNLLGKSKRGNWLFVKDIQPPNIMFQLPRQLDLGDPVIVDVGIVEPRSPKEIVKLLFKFYYPLVNEGMLRDSESTAVEAFSTILLDSILYSLGMEEGYNFLIDVRNNLERNDIRTPYEGFMQVLEEKVISLEPFLSVTRSPFGQQNASAPFRSAA